MLWPSYSVLHRIMRREHSFSMVNTFLSRNGTLLTSLVAHIPLFLYPFLNTTSKTRPFEYLRLTSLGVIGALVRVSLLPVFNDPDLTSNSQQNDNSSVIHFLLSTEIIPLCLRIMETGSELSKTVAIF